jgi:dTDP-4-dehydrorhamnose reductase
MRVAVFGARGQLGAAMVHEFRERAASPGRNAVFAFDRAAVDITSPESVAVALDRVKPDVLINCAAYNAVDAAEGEPVEALRVNAFSVRTLARAARDHGATLVHYSSDFVFGGTGHRPHTEADRVNPLSVYGTSKMMGEWFAADAPDAYVLRVETLFGRFPDGPPEKGSVAGIVNGLRVGTVLKVFEDRTVSPTYVMDAVRATRELIERKAPAGLYHCVNSGCCTWVEFALEAARLLDVEPRIQPVRLADMLLRARRPLYCAMSNEKLAAAGIPMPTWQDALGRYVSTL